MADGMGESSFAGMSFSKILYVGYKTEKFTFKLREYEPTTPLPLSSSKLQGGETDV
jgi:hypothetical protein